MDVRCPQCQTLYELDDAQVRRSAVTLKCSQCQHVFRLEKSSSVQENQRRWMVRRKKEGDILYLNTFDVLHEWIMQQDVQAEDEISRTGDQWMVLGEIGEFMPMFHVVASISALEGGDEPEASPEVSSIAIRVPEEAGASAERQRQRPGRDRVRTAVQFGGESSSTRKPMRTEAITKKSRPTHITPPELPPSPAAEGSGPEEAPEISTEAPAPRSEAPLDVDLSLEAEAVQQPPASSGSNTGIIVFALSMLAVGSGAYLWMTQGDDIANPGVVPLGEKEGQTTGAGASERGDPIEALAQARDAAIRAANEQNDSIWTLWHAEASGPFYVALDAAYAAADEASVGVELGQMLKNARVALENGKLEEANRTFRMVLAKDNSNPAAITGLGWTLLAQGRASQAVAQFKLAMQLDPEFGDAYIGLGSAYRNTGEYQKAYDAYDLYLGRFPRGDKASIASYQLGQLKKQLGL